MATRHSTGRPRTWWTARASMKCAVATAAESGGRMSLAALRGIRLQEALEQLREQPELVVAHHEVALAFERARHECVDGVAAGRRLHRALPVPGAALPQCVELRGEVGEQLGLEALALLAGAGAARD